MNDQKIVYEYLQDVQYKLLDREFLIDNNQVTTVIQQLIDLASFLLEKIKDSCYQNFEFESSMEELNQSLRQDILNLQTSLFQYQTLYSEEIEKKKKNLQQICLLEEENSKYKYQNMLISSQLAMINAEQLIQNIKQLQQENAELVFDINQLQQSNYTLKSQKIDLQLNNSKNKNQLTELSEEILNLKQQVLDLQQKNKFQSYELLLKPPSLQGSFLTPLIEPNRYILKKSMSTSLNLSRYQNSETESYLKTETEEIPIANFVRQEAKKAKTQVQIIYQTHKQDDSDEESTKSSHLITLSNELQHLEETEIAPKDFVALSDNLAIDRETPKCFVASEDDQNIKTVETEIIEDGKPIYQWLIQIFCNIFITIQKCKWQL